MRLKDPLITLADLPKKPGISAVLVKAKRTPGKEKEHHSIYQTEVINWSSPL